MVKLRAFKLDTVMHLYWVYLEGRNYASIDNILKVMTFLKNSHLHFLPHLTYMPKILILHLAHHTHTHTDTHRHIQIPFSQFALFGSFGTHAKYIYTCQIYLAYHRLTHSHTLRHVQTLTHR